jgi:hypothetical protein
MSLVRLVGLEPTTGKTPVDFKPTAYANFATAAPGVYAAPKEYHVRRNIEQTHVHSEKAQNLVATALVLTGLHP